MCCQKMKTYVRRELRQPAAQAPNTRSGIPGRVDFEYVGRTTLTTRGPVTGRVYRFGAPGSRVAVDVRDQASIAAVPHLRRIGH
jgi:hypothetical protein